MLARYQKHEEYGGVQAERDVDKSLNEAVPHQTPKSLPGALHRVVSQSLACKVISQSTRVVLKVSHRDGGRERGVESEKEVCDDHGDELHFR